MGLCGNFTANPNPNPGSKQRRHYLLFANSKSIDNFTDSRRNFKNLNHNEFVADLDNAPWSLLDMFDDVNEKLDTWKKEKSETYAFITVDKQWHLTAYAPWRPVQSTCQIKHSGRHNVQKITLLGDKDNGQGRDGLCEERDLQKYE